jgi:sugar O-acyltransferase (sialic acid O-acetyltransferase NeuD family)
MNNRQISPPPRITHKHLLIIGTGGQGKVVMDCAEKYYNKISFMTNDLNSKKINNYPILFEEDITFDYILKNFDEVIVAIGNNNARLNLSLKYISYGIKLATIIHPNAVVSKYALVKEGTVIFANAVVNSFAKIGKACIINTGSIIEHDCILGDGVHVSPNAAIGGTVTIGKKTWICLGSSIANNIKIGGNVIVGAGSVVLNDVSDNVLVAGIPAIIKKKYN